MTEVTQITGRQINELNAIKCRLEHERRSFAVKYEAFEKDDDLAMFDLLDELSGRLDDVNQELYTRLNDSIDVECVAEKGE